MKAKELICQAVELIRELVSGMTNFLTYTEQVFKFFFLAVVECHVLSLK